MKKFVKTATQVLTGVSAMLCLYTGRALATTSVEEGAKIAKADGMPSELLGENGVISRLSTIVLLGVGAISVVMLIYGGFRYILSGGDAKKVTDAKNTILYAIIGLIISLLAYAIVNFILTSVIGVQNA